MLHSVNNVHKTMTRFRYDINGLRAWAVLAVIFYHFKLFRFTGGYAGVDVFFVISGFLMTKIIVDKLCAPRNQFSLAEFYLSRAKRIIPPLFVLCVILIIMGYHILIAPQYHRLSSEIIRANTFLSNYKFFKDAGYFDTAANTKWLLHTWSLSVEWQFYLILPLMLIITYKLSATKRAIKLVVLISTLLSLLLSIFLTKYKPTFSFYFLPTRSWEMLIGGCVYLYLDGLGEDKFSKTREWLGFFLIVASYFTLTDKTIWPGWLAMIPVFGAALVISAKRENSALTHNSLFQYLGNISYSLYLWHWPIYVFLVYYELDRDNLYLFSGLFVAVACAHLSYILIETPGRKLFNKKPYYLSLSKIIIPVAVFLILPFYVKSHHGLVNPLAINVEKITNEAANKNPRALACELLQENHPDKPPECTYGGKKLGVILLGDSHASALALALEKALPNKELHVLDWSILACPASLKYSGDSEKKRKCVFSNQYFFEKNKHLTKEIPLLMVNYVNEENRMEMACEIAKYRTVYLLRPTPQFRASVPNMMANNIMKNKKEVRLKISIADNYNKVEEKSILIQDKAARQCGIKILETLPYLCKHKYCYGDHKGLPIYYDEHHLNLRGADLLIPELKKIFMKRTQLT